MSFKPPQVIIENTPSPRLGDFFFEKWMSREQKADLFPPPEYGKALLVKYEDGAIKTEKVDIFK